MQSWYNSFNRWVAAGECPFARGGIKPFEKIVDPEIFNECLDEYFLTDVGDLEMNDVLWSNEKGHPDRKIDGFKFRIQTKLIKKYFTQGPAFLTDIRFIESAFGFPG